MKNDRMTPNQIKRAIHEAARDLDERGTPAHPNPMVPPWEQYPEIPRYSVGWRMGPGEDYWRDFGDWFLKLTDQELRQYIQGKPEPTGWEGFFKILSEERNRNN